MIKNYLKFLSIYVLAGGFFAGLFILINNLNPSGLPAIALIILGGLIAFVFVIYFTEELIQKFTGLETNITDLLFPIFVGIVFYPMVIFFLGILGASNNATDQVITGPLSIIIFLIGVFLGVFWVSLQLNKIQQD